MSDTPESTPGAEKPALKVTRSPFAPKISGAVTAAPKGPMSIGAGDTLADAAAKVPTGPRSFSAPTPSRSNSSEETSIVMFIVDLVCAGVSVAAAVLLALKYF